MAILLRNDVAVKPPLKYLWSSESDVEVKIGVEGQQRGRYADGTSPSPTKARELKRRMVAESVSMQRRGQNWEGARNGPSRSASVHLPPLACCLFVSLLGR